MKTRNNRRKKVSRYVSEEMLGIIRLDEKIYGKKREVKGRLGYGSGWWYGKIK